MTDTSKKLREALQAISDIDDSTNHAVDASAALDRIGRIARQALALPTADHIPDAGEKVDDHLPDAGKMIETAAPGGGYVRPVVLDARQALPTAEQVDDINVAESFTSVTKTAAPVGDLPELPEPYRALDKHLSHPILRQVLFAPGEYFTADQMRAYARAALSAGEAMDAQRLDDLRRNAWSLCSFVYVPASHVDRGIGWRVVERSDRVVSMVFDDDPRAAIDAAMRKAQL